MEIELNKIHMADCLSGLKTLPDKCVNCCVTSPPYYGLRDYGHKDQTGLESTPELFISALVEIFQEVRRVLKDDGTLWINIGDSYATGGRGYSDDTKRRYSKDMGWKSAPPGFKHKDLIGIPWMLAFALRASGWYLRQDIIWHKKNCMPESMKDRCTKTHEYIFLLSKSPQYYYDQVAIQEDAVWDIDGSGTLKRKLRQNDENKSLPGVKTAGMRKVYEDVKTGTAFKSVTGKRNKRSVWNMPTAQFPAAHFATFPEELPYTCILAGCPENGIVLDPFMGAGTTALVAQKLNRNFIGFELNSEYIEIANKRLKNELGMFL